MNNQSDNKTNTLFVYYYKPDQFCLQYKKSIFFDSIQNIGSLIDQLTDAKLIKPEKDKPIYNFNQKTQQDPKPTPNLQKDPNLDRNSHRTHRLKQNPDAKSCRRLRSEGRHNKNKNRGQKCLPTTFFFVLSIVFYWISNANSVTKQIGTSMRPTYVLDPEREVLERERGEG